MINIVIVSNVLISSLIFGGNPRRVINHVIDGKIKLYLSEFIISEVLEIIAVKFDYPKNKLLAVENELLSICEMIYPDIKIEAVRDDPDDNSVLECAVASKADYIVSGDKHLLKLKKFNNIEIIRAADFLKLI